MRMLICSIGTKQRNHTLGFGAEVAAALASQVTLLGVVDNQRKIGKLETALNQVATELSLRVPDIHVEVVAGDPETTIQAQMATITYDLVALGALATKRARKTLFETVGMRLIEQATTSVLLIKGNRQHLSRVLICASGTEHGHMSVWAGAALACGAQAEATVLHVTDAMPAMYAGLEQMEETLSELLQSDTEPSRELKWAAQVVKAECEPSELKLRRGIVADEILREGQVGDYDLIVIGSPQRAKGLMRAVMGNVTRTVTSRAQRPVLVVRPMD